MNQLVESLNTSQFSKDILHKVDRGFFINTNNCYVDKPMKLVINGVDTEQTISAPHMHAKAIEYMEPVLKHGNKILDIGSGSGYLTTCFAEAVAVNNPNEKERGKVIGLEIIDELFNYSNDIINNNFNHLRIYKKNFKILNKDGKHGYPKQAKNELYNGIHVGAACEFIPHYLLTQLKKNGILLIPLKVRENNVMFCVIKKDHDGNIHIEEKVPVRYVPMI